MPGFAANLTMLSAELPFRDRFAAASDAGFLFPNEHDRQRPWPFRTLPPRENAVPTLEHDLLPRMFRAAVDAASPKICVPPICRRPRAAGRWGWAGVMGKMISPQNIATGVPVTDLKGQEGVVFACPFKHSIALTVLLGLLVVAQRYLVPWMIP